MPSGQDLARPDTTPRVNEEGCARVQERAIENSSLIGHLLTFLVFKWAKNGFTRNPSRLTLVEFNFLNPLSLNSFDV